MKTSTIKNFDELTHRGQTVRYRQLAKKVLDQYDLNDPEIRFIFNGENITFRIIERNVTGNSGPYLPGHYLLRISRPGKETSKTIKSEMSWLTALSNDAGIPVPKPVRSKSGKYSVEMGIDGIPHARNCVLLKWLGGRRTRKPTPEHYRMNARLMAQLHNHASKWKRPKWFTRHSWDENGLFRDTRGFDMDSDTLWSLLPKKVRRNFEKVETISTKMMSQLGKSPDVFGLIHADLILGNIVFKDSQARAFDFDDSGFGWFIYDIAVALDRYRKPENWDDYVQAFLDGYREYRELDKEILDYLDTFLTARQVTVGVWMVGVAQSNPEFRKYLDRWLQVSTEKTASFLNKHR